MATRNRKKRFSKVTAVKEMARDQVGTPPPTRREEPALRKKRKSQKHKTPLGRLLQEND